MRACIAFTVLAIAGCSAPQICDREVARLDRMEEVVDRCSKTAECVITANEMMALMNQERRVAKVCGRES